ncbi:MAG: hypothetical protein FWE36_06165 [Erysipelotrichales bacterium]|nr:hypothetical protein [Erysipelotrichales bacterium]
MSAGIKEYQANYFILRPESKGLVLQFRGAKVPLRIENGQIVMKLFVNDSREPLSFESEVEL